MLQFVIVDLKGFGNNLFRCQGIAVDCIWSTPLKGEPHLLLTVYLHGIRNPREDFTTFIDRPETLGANPDAPLVSLTPGLTRGNHTDASGNPYPDVRRERPDHQ